MTSTRYRKKAVVINAMQLTESNAAAVKAWVESFYDGRVVMRGGPGGGSNGAFLVIRTLEGDHLASVGDFVIQGVSDEAYPCKPEIFAATYEPADDESPVEDTRPDVTEQTVERACELMHDAYEAAAVREGWETQERSRKPWSDVPEANKATMRAAVRALAAAGLLAATITTTTRPTREQIARALWEHDMSEGTTPEWREMAWNDMGGSEKSEERVEYELRAVAVLALIDGSD